MKNRKLIFKDFNEVILCSQGRILNLKLKDSTYLAKRTIPALLLGHALCKFNKHFMTIQQVFCTIPKQKHIQRMGHFCFTPLITTQATAIAVEAVTEVTGRAGRLTPYPKQRKSQ